MTTYDDLPEEIQFLIMRKKRHLEIQEGLKNLPRDWGIPYDPMVLSCEKRKCVIDLMYRNGWRTRHIKRKTILKFKVGESYNFFGNNFVVVKIARKLIWLDNGQKLLPSDVQRLIDMSMYIRGARPPHPADFQQAFAPYI